MEDLITAASRALEKSYSHEILGDVIFEAEDGKTYMGVVSFELIEPTPEYLETILEDDE